MGKNINTISFFLDDGGVADPPKNEVDSTELLYTPERGNFF